MRDIFLTVLNMSVTGGIAVLVVLVARLLLHRAPKIFPYALWAVVLFRLLCPVTLMSSFSVLPVRHPIQAEMAAEDTKISVTIPPSANHYYAAQGQTLAEEEGQPEIPASPFDWAVAGTAVWLTGTVALLLWGAASLVSVRRRLVGAVPLAGNVWVADHIPSPFVLGLLHPKVYLPSDLLEKELDYILLHERTHIRRKDHLIRGLAFFALAIHWFNPLAWLAFYLAGKDMEMSCDEWVLRHMEMDVRGDYASSLLRLSAGKRLPTGPLAFGEGDPQSRIKNVLSYKRPALWVIVVAFVATLTAGMALATNPVTETPDSGLSIIPSDDPAAPSPSGAVDTVIHFQTKGVSSVPWAVPPFAVTLTLPDGWTVKETTRDRNDGPFLAGAMLYSSFYILDETGTIVGATGWNPPTGLDPGVSLTTAAQYDPVSLFMGIITTPDEWGFEDGHEAVRIDDRLVVFLTETVKSQWKTSQPQGLNRGIMARSEEIPVLLFIELDSERVTEEQARAIAESLNFTR